MSIISTNKLNRLWNKGIKPLIKSIESKFDRNKMLNTLEEITANTSSEYGAGALAVKEISSNLSELNGSLGQLITFDKVSTTVNIAQGFKTITIKTPSNSDYIWHRIETACSGFVTVMNGADDTLAVESNIAGTISITFVSTFIGVKKNT